MKKKWTDYKRKDLNGIPMMIKKGFELVFSYADNRKQRTTSEHLPIFPINFKKEDLHIWILNDNRWNTAYLTATHYCDHKKFETLKEASERIVKRPIIH